MLTIYDLIKHAFIITLRGWVFPNGSRMLLVVRDEVKKGAYKEMKWRLCPCRNRAMHVFWKIFTWKENYILQKNEIQRWFRWKLVR